MAKQGIFNSIKRKLCVILSMLLIVCSAGLIFVACDDDTNSSYTDKTYTHEWNDEAKIKNGSFEFGSDDLEDKQFPQSSSVNSWALSTDNSAQSSLVSSGIIRTNQTSWDKLIENLYDDTDFRNYAQKKWDFSSSLSKEEAIDKISENLENPKTPYDAKGDKIYMLNNYPSSISLGGIGLGTAQKLTSSTTVTLTPASYGKITVFVKTVNLAHNGSGDKYGANIRISNTVSTTTQAEYRISGINTENGSTTVDQNGWAKYEIFVKADDFINNSLIISVGLGYGDGSSTSAKYFCEGTAYFDDITYEEITDETIISSIEQKFANFDLTDESTQTDTGIVKYETSAKDPNEKLSINGQTFYFSMDVDDSLKAHAPNYFKEYTTSPTTSFAQKFSDSNGSLSTVKNDGDNKCEYSLGENIYKVDVTNTSFVMNFGSKETPFSTLKPETYNQVTFYLKNDLSEFDINGISVIVYDVYSKNGSTPIEKSFETIKPTFEEDGKWVKVSFNVANNFPEKNIEDKFLGDERSYYFKVIIGPTDVTATAQKYAYANGSVLMSFPFVAEGVTYNYVRSAYKQGNGTEYPTYNDAINAGIKIDSYVTAESLPENKTEYSDYYSLFLGVASNKFALYNGLSADYKDDAQKDTYYLTTSPSNIGSILSNPADPDGFTGVHYDHAYINGESTTFDVNDRSGNGTAFGNAGLVNTKYIPSYTNGTEIANALNYNFSTPKQPLMIYNAVEDSYGYIGEELTLSAKGALNVRLRLRVVGDANAYIYLVDTSKAKKSVMNISVPANTDGSGYLKDNVVTHTNDLSFKIDSSMMREDENGWVTLNFYLAAGNNTKTLRLELWNGSRDGQEKSSGYVFFDEISTAGSFTEPSSSNYREQFTTDGVLLNALIYDKDDSFIDTAILHKRELDEREITYNNDKNRKNEQVSYPAKYVWVKTDTTIYAIYNTLEVESVDPYLSEPTDEEEKGCGGCDEADQSNFWLSFSTIFLGVALGVALIALFIKGYLTRRKANKNDAKSHYNVSSRYKQKKNKKDKSSKNSDKEVSAENAETPSNEKEEIKDAEDAKAENNEGEVNKPENEEVTSNENGETIEEPTTPSDEDIIYGDVTDFGDNNEENK